MKYASGKRRPHLFRRTPRASLPFSLIVLGVIFLIFLLIPTSPLNTNINFGPGFTPPPATATVTPTPPATIEHGGRIVFTCTRGDFNQLCLIKPDGTGLALLTSGSAHNYYPAFSPRGEYLAFVSTRNGPFDLYRLTSATGELFQLTKNIGNPFSPDYSPDGKKILFLNRIGEGPASLWVVDVDGKDPRMLYDGPESILGAAWSPDGNTIAFAMAESLPNEFEIFLLDLGNQTPYPQRISRGLLGIGGSIDWSPDGGNILIYAGPPGDKDIFRIDVATGNFTQLTFGGNNASAAYSPDGQWIAYNSTANDDQADLFIMRYDGQLTRQLTDDPEPDWQPHWEP
jgi:Tol biopolymer transport system component